MVTLRKRVVGFAVGLILFLSVSTYYRYQIQNTLSYASRPLWDTPEGPKHIIPHFWAPGIDPSEEICKLHGYTLREKKKQVWDAVLLSTELDLLEIRMSELDGVVDRFFVIESDRTFTGLPKPTYFKNALSTPQFARFASKTTYALHPGRIPKLGESPFEVEKEQRGAMTRLITTHLERIPSSPPSPAAPDSFIDPAPLVIMSDVDEIPSAYTIDLVRSCTFPKILHLQMQNYVYSFEWPSGWGSWRAQVHEWTRGSFYMHSKAGEDVLADSGWHCSFCFGSIEEFVTKMRGYSHADRIGGDLKLLDPKRIQETICSGKDIFNMLPEAYTYKDMFQLMNPEPTKSAVGLPRHILEHSERFRYLLPGGCNRSRTG